MVYGTTGSRGTAQVAGGNKRRFKRHFVFFQPYSLLYKSATS